MISIIFSGSTLAGEKIDRSLDVSKSGVVLINVTRGFVKINGWDKPKVQLQGELDDSIDKLIFKNNQNKTLVKIVTKDQNHWGDGSALQLFMPYESKLRFKGVDTIYSIKGLKNGLEGRTISGDLILEDISDLIELSTVSGDIKVIESSGRLKLESVNGSIDYSGEFIEANIQSMSGDVNANIAHTDKLLIKNISGETRIVGNVKNHAKVELNSVSGDISYQPPEELDAKCEIVSQFGGEISNSFTDDRPTKSILQKNNLRFVSGEGSGQLIIHTLSGKVTIDE